MSFGVAHVAGMAECEGGEPRSHELLRRRRGVVEFVASWHDPRTGESGRLHEVSRFRFALGRWYYLDGEVGADR